jgi:hypothetical protein
MPYWDGRVQELRAAAGAALGLGVFYWLIAAGAIVAALYYPKSRKLKAVAAGLAIVLFSLFPAKLAFEAYAHSRYAQEAWAHFRKLCAEKAGEKIYKTFTGVKGVVVLKPLPPASDKDHFDQYWYGDPYSAFAHSERGMHEAGNLIGIVEFTPDKGGRQKGFETVDIRVSNKGMGSVFRISRSAEHPFRRYVEIPESDARFGVSWEDISTPTDRRFWVAGSRLSIVDLESKALVAERIGYFIEAGFGSAAGARRPWLTSRGPRSTCPELTNGTYEDRWFVLKVLKPEEK